MVKEYEFLMQKCKSDSKVKSSLRDFGFAVTEIPWPDTAVKEIAKRNWPGEHGEDAYFPSMHGMEAYDLSVKFVYKGDLKTSYGAMKKLREYLMGMDGDGTEMRVYDPYNGIGKAGVTLSKMTDREPHRTSLGDVLEMTVVFRVTSPVSELTLNPE